jgi:hypothetical protein
LAVHRRGRDAIKIASRDLPERARVEDGPLLSHCNGFDRGTYGPLPGRRAECISRTENLPPRD